MSLRSVGDAEKQSIAGRNVNRVPGAKVIGSGVALGKGRMANPVPQVLELQPLLPLPLQRLLLK